MSNVIFPIQQIINSTTHLCHKTENVNINEYAVGSLNVRFHNKATSSRYKYNQNLSMVSVLQIPIPDVV